MAFKLEKVIWSIPVQPASAKFVLLCLAHRAKSSTNLCWPSLPTIAKDTGLQVKTVRKALKVLEAQSLIIRSDRPGTSSQFTLNLEALENMQSGNLQNTPPKIGRAALLGTTKYGGRPPPKLGGDPSQIRDTNIERTEKEQRRAPARKATLLPKDFSISEGVRSWAHQKGWTDKELKTHLEHFMDWTQAKGQKYVDWDAALRSHIRRNMEKVKQSGKKPKTIGGVYAS